MSNIVSNSDLVEIVHDINSIIADVETYSITTPSKDGARVIGQLKAARVSLMRMTAPPDQVKEAK